MKLFRLKQHFQSNALVNIPQQVTQALERLSPELPKGRIAITAGSRGITNIAQILETSGAWLRANGRIPFIVAAMGSHGGATSEGQRAVLHALGITPDSTKMEIRTDMETVCVAEKCVGKEESIYVYLDRHCAQADGILVINRIKAHSSLTGPIQSGLAKMMVVGLGKKEAAAQVHNARPEEMGARLKAMAELMLATGKIAGGLAIIEDGDEQTAELHALKAEEFLAREPELLTRSMAYFPRLPVDNINVLIVCEIGKNFSGTGMDPNVIGYRGIRGYEDISSPRIRALAALRLSEESQGNALGIGLADATTRICRQAINERKTAINALTTGHLGRARIPLTFETDQELISAFAERFGNTRWMFIPNTRDLRTLYVSEDLAAELSNHPRCTLDKDFLNLSFASDGHCELDF